MSIIDDLRTYLLADATVASLIGTRMFPVKLPQNPTFPAVMIQTISGERVHSTDGASGLAGPRIQIDCWAESYADADAVFEAVRKRLDGKGNGDIQGMFIQSERDDFDFELGIYNRSMDVFVWHKEATV